MTDNSENYRPVCPGARLLTVGSSIWWERVGGGYFRCSFDQGRNVYAFLTLLDPSVMRDVLNTYLSQYDRDGFLMGNWDPFDPAAWADQQWGFFGYFFLAARLEGVTGVDYGKAEHAILATMGMTASTMYLARVGYYKYGYVPANVGTDKYLSRGLEFATDLAGLAHLADVVGDQATFRAYAPYATAYRATWNSAMRIFQARNTDGSWAPPGAGLFEGTTTTYAFDEPQDALGLARTYGDSVMSSKIASIYAVPDLPYNDYQLIQPYLAIWADDPSLSQRVIRDYLPPNQLAHHVGNASRQRFAVLHRQRKRRGPRQPRHLSDSVSRRPVDPQQSRGDSRRHPRSPRHDHPGAGQYAGHSVRLRNRGRRRGVPQPVHLWPDARRAQHHTGLHYGGQPGTHRPDIHHGDRR